MRLVPLKDIEIRSRQRSNIATGPLNDLKDSILNIGLLNPPVCWHDEATQTWVLVAGERRMRALRELAADGKKYYCGLDAIEPGTIPITPLGDYLDHAGRFEAELDENVQRVDLDWPDRMRAYAALHSLRCSANPGQTVSDTGRELAERAKIAVDADGVSRTANRQITQAIVIAQHLDNEKIALARNPAEALQLIYRQEEEKAMAALIKRQIAKLPSKPTIEIRHADLFALLPKLDSESFDLIIADPPYGIEASSPGFRSRSVHHHNYTDTIDIAKTLTQTILTEGFRLTKSRANIFVFCDIDLFPWLKLTAQNMGWTVFRRPLVWLKSESEGLAPWGGQGPRITTEFILYGTKGQRGLNASPTDVLDFRRVSRESRVHGAEKPVALFESLIQCSSLPGDRLLDPCCGSGSALLAAKRLQRCGLGIEIDQDYYNAALTKVFGTASTSSTTANSAAP